MIAALVVALLASTPLRDRAFFLPFWILVFLGMCLVNARYLLYVFLASLFLFAPAKPQGTWLSLTDVVILFVCGEMFFSFRRPFWVFDSVSDRKEETLLLALLGVAALSVVVVYLRGADLGRAAASLVRMAEYFLAFVCLSNLLRETGLLERAEEFLAVLTIVISWFGVYQHWIGPEASGTRFGWGPWWTVDYFTDNFRVYSVFTNPIYFSTFCACAMALSLDGWTRSAKRQKTLYALTFLSASLALSFTLSRSGLIAALAGVLIVGVRSRRALGLAALASALIICLVTPSQFRQRIMLQTTDAIVNTLGRLAAAEEALQIIGQNPVFGVGLGQYPGYVMREIRGDVTPEQYDSLTAENTFLQFGAELGLPGVLLMILLQALLLQRGLRLSRAGVPGGKGLLGAAMAFVLSNFFASMTAASMMFLFILLVVLGKMKSRPLPVPRNG